jgi:hypothetical protein
VAREIYDDVRIRRRRTLDKHRRRDRRAGAQNDTTAVSSARRACQGKTAIPCQRIDNIEALDSARNTVIVSGFEGCEDNAPKTNKRLG